MAPVSTARNIGLYFGVQRKPTPISLGCLLLLGVTIFSQPRSPERMLLYGKSAGGRLGNVSNYAHAEDTTVSASVPISGVVRSFSASEVAPSNFRPIAQQLGCPSDKDEELSCL